MENIAFDSHKRYTFCSVENADGVIVEEGRIDHVRGAIGRFLERFTPGSPVAVETIGNWYWIIDEIEEAGMRPKLVHARKAKVMMGCINKTDRLDARGLNRLQHLGRLPTVWIPPGELRDQRDLPRTRMYLVHQRTQLKNRIHSVLGKYGLRVDGVSDIFGKRGRALLGEHIIELPRHTRFVTRLQLGQVERLDGVIGKLDQRIQKVFRPTPEVALLISQPGIGFVLAVVISLEVGDVSRFSGPDKLAAYAGTVPRVHASGGRVRYGALRSDVNHYLKWAFSEAANSVGINKEVWPQRHVSCLYKRVRARKGHATAIGAVARHLAEATYWVLTKKEKYREPCLRQVVPMEA